MKQYFKKNHEFGPVIDKNSEILVLGSFPSVKSLEDSFYYMHPQNRFWKLLSLIYHDDFVNKNTINKRKLLSKYHIALYDVIESCDVIKSADSSIKNEKSININNLIKDTQIQKIYINGGKAFNLFIKYNSDLANLAKKLPSTSSANARFSLQDLYDEWQIIKIS